MTRAEFVTLFERYLKRDDLADLYSTFIEMGEARLNQVMRLSEQEFRATSTPTAAFWSLPTDFVEMRHIQATNAGGSRALDYVTAEQADEFRRRINAGGYRVYTILDNQIEIIPHPTVDSTSEVEMFYYAKLDPIVEDADTNPVLTNYPNLYLYACLLEASLYREDNQAVQTWASALDSYAEQLNTRHQSARFSGNSLQMRAV